VIIIGELKLDKRQKKEMVRKLQEYFLNERDDNLGDLAAGLLVDFIISELGAPIYNQGIADAYRYLSQQIEGLFELEKY